MAIARRPGTDCGRVRGALPALAGGDDVDHDGDLWSHLRACASCRAEYGGYVRAGRALARLAELPEPRPGFFAELERDTLQALPTRGRAPRRRWVVAAACFLMGMAAGPIWQWLSPALGDRLPAAPTGSRGAAGLGARSVERLSYSSRHQGLLGQQQADRSRWADGHVDAPRGPR